MEAATAVDGAKMQAAIENLQTRTVALMKSLEESAANLTPAQQNMAPDELMKSLWDPVRQNIDKHKKDIFNYKILS